MNEEYQSSDSNRGKTKMNFQQLTTRITSHLKVQEISQDSCSSLSESPKKKVWMSQQFKHPRQQFRFDISPDSSQSDEYLSLSPIQKAGVEERLQNYATEQLCSKDQQIPKRPFWDQLSTVEQKKAAQNWRYLAGGYKPNAQQTTSIGSYMSPMIPMLPLKLNDSTRQKEKSTISQNNERPQNILYLRGLAQNKIVENPTQVDEAFEKNKITIKLKTKDFFTFIRLEHETDELRRKQNDFNDHRQRHINLQTGERFFEEQQSKLKYEKEQKEKRFNQSWFVGVALAKRFLKKARNKKVSRIAQSIIRGRQRSSTLMGLTPKKGSASMQSFDSGRICERIMAKLKQQKGREDLLTIKK